MCARQSAHPRAPPAAARLAPTAASGPRHAARRAVRQPVQSADKLEKKRVAASADGRRCRRALRARECCSLLALQATTCWQHCLPLRARRSAAMRSFALLLLRGCCAACGLASLATGVMGAASERRRRAARHAARSQLRRRENASRRRLRTDDAHNETSRHKQAQTRVRAQRKMQRNRPERQPMS